MVYYTVVLPSRYPPRTYIHTQSLATRTRLWYLIDARGQVVGRLASMVSLLLQGKTKPVYHPAGDLPSSSSPLSTLSHLPLSTSPLLPSFLSSYCYCKYWLFSTSTHTHTHTVDMGDHVVVINTRHVVFTGNKWDKKLYRHHTGLAYPCTQAHSTWPEYETFILTK